MRELGLLNGGVTLLDDEDYEMFAFMPWRRMDGRSTPYVRINLNIGHQKIIGLWLHRLIANPALHEFVDHVNGNGLDNRRQNLRVCTSSQNTCNSKRREDNTSGVSGVSWDKRLQKWIITIAYRKSRVYFGSFADFDEAVRARNAAVQQMHGEFGRMADVG